ncbi:MAG: DHH family phosphoesterase [Bifidobacteriaceae bacterium]|nr:DHH family phosphoesterase [Bifidobacteriaceae bacterium]
MDFESQLMPLVLERRGWDNDWLETHTNPAHRSLGNLDEMCEQLKAVHDSGQLIVILPDFDTDGVMAGVVGWAGLNQLGFRCGLYAPHPENGYGIAVQDIDRAEQEFPGVQAFITCDVGITCHEALSHAREQGKTVLVTDHHEPDGTPIEADCVVDPSADKEAYGWDGICGAHVFWQILCRYADLYDPSRRDAIDRLRVFAGIATISDMMPLWKENRLLVKQSIADSNALATVSPESLSDGTPVGAALAGLCVLYRVFQRAGKLYLPIDEQTYGWTIAPAINSLKRLEKPMNIIQCLFTSPHLSDKYVFAERLIEASNQRKNLVAIKTNLLRTSVLEKHQPYAPSIFLTDAPNGILGLLANTVLGETGMPVLVLRPQTNGYTGSGRAPYWFDFLSWLRKDGLGIAAGHAQAFGYSVEGCSGADLTALSQRIKTAAEQAKPIIPLVPKFDFTVGATVPAMASASSAAAATGNSLNPSPDVAFSDTTELVAFAHDCARLAPWGEDWPNPIARLEIPLSAPWSTLSGGKHAKCTLADGVEAMFWNTTPEQIVRQMHSGEGLRATIGLHEWRGHTTAQFTGV